MLFYTLGRRTASRVGQQLAEAAYPIKVNSTSARGRRALCVMVTVMLIAMTACTVSFARATETVPTPTSTDRLDDTGLSTPVASATQLLPPTVSAPEGCATDLSAGVWEIRFGVTGGFAGVSQSLTLSSNGEFKAVDEGAATEVSGEAPPADLQSVREALAGSCPPWAVGRPPACADCFIYSVRLEWNEERFEVELNDVSLPTSAQATLVGALGHLLDQALAGLLGG